VNSPFSLNWNVLAMVSKEEMIKIEDSSREICVGIRADKKECVSNKVINFFKEWKISEIKENLK